MLLCGPSQKGSLALDLQPHNQTCFVSVALNFCGAKPTDLCEPSPEGLARAAPACTPPIIFPGFNIDAIGRFLCRNRFSYRCSPVFNFYQKDTAPERAKACLRSNRVTSPRKRDLAMQIDQVRNRLWRAAAKTALGGYAEISHHLFSRGQPALCAG